MVTQVNVMMEPNQPVLVLMAVSHPDGYQRRPLYQKDHYWAVKVCEILDNIHQMRIPTQLNVMTAPARPVLTAQSHREYQENHHAPRVAPRPALTAAPPPRVGREGREGNVPERRDSAVTELT